MKKCNPGTLLVISAPSGTGKTTLCARLIREIPRLRCSVSVTTRPRRPGERHGRDYFFVTPETFMRYRKQGALLEYANVFGNYYGTPREFVQQHLARGIDVLLNIDVQGAMQIKRRLGRQALFVFIEPPSLRALKDRLKKRGTDSAAEISRRLGLARQELSYVPQYDYRVVNDEIEQAYRDIAAIVLACRCRVLKKDVV